MTTDLLTDWNRANQRYLRAALARLCIQLTSGDSRTAEQEAVAAVAAMPAPAAIDQLAAIFGLSPFEADLLLLCAGAELDPAVAVACATAHGDPQRTRPTAGLALARLAQA
ncbi:MAG TPA: ATP-binding protein, partial [Roseiflexaceae bacterium]|nr:ATP-binding protein [Roseiflexaceae bacterium]